MELALEEPVSRTSRSFREEQVSRTSRSFRRDQPVAPSDFIDEGWDVSESPTYSLQVKNLSYKVAVKNNGEGPGQKILLNDICVEAFAGELLAIVGPSGSGKTTFLDALAGRIVRESLEGEILVNGHPINNSFRRISGYVMQDDALFPMLTVRETLLISARLRLPASMPLKEKKLRVDNMIAQLGLENCANTRVGNEKVRGVSGGERRRVSIGSDLIHDPAVIFLDEPTSGLDSTSALNVMQVLSRMAKTGKRTVILTIHQPSFRILETIDRVVVLGRGSVLYEGALQQLKRYFGPLGRTMPEDVNVLEFALDTIEDFQKSPAGLEPLIKLQLESRKLEVEKGEKREERKVQVGPGGASSSYPEYATSFLAQCYILTGRNLKNVLRTPELFVSRVMAMLLVAITLGTLFLNSKVSERGIRQRTGFISFTLALLIFWSMEAMAAFIEERQIFIRETSRGAYRVGAFVVAKDVTMIPLLLLLGTIFSVISYFLVDLVREAPEFFLFTFTCFLVLCTAYSYVSFVSTLVPNFAIGTSICSTTISYMFLFSGFFIERTAIPKYWIWLHYISLFKYPYEVMLQNEFGSKHFENTIWYGDVDSNTVLSNLGAGKVHIWVNLVAMLGIFVGYRLFFWFSLSFFNRSVRK
ncbi:ATP-binding cassette, subfamily G (WHITE), member 2 [Marchantia polymorpha subsp. ruderalis]|uniref:ABC transporter domain-containing protein n=2 Tax=Marchantia polymorpha TaxID=3197 RepID=A0A176W4C0_MARPO|nr:hypothetical protein AXG93_3911s1760 [Marchantia polymorpha subsp. ruderalis]PTQ36719.1 hypothetical protein MARPO_0061s0001 [Marchantia polymorpha]BBM99967.1 hypothetical protein Mp_1g25240 [Marchantia polymorpha subsp. ruderalis]|eukprot:PTQ36719.1 hypothetical protein MARPO_0061s0001 [Marchantia polymorpha]